MKNKYRVINWRTWSVIDDTKDTFEILIEGDDKDVIQTICDKFNNDPSYDKYQAQLDYLTLADPLGGLSIVDVCQTL